MPDYVPTDRDETVSDVPQRDGPVERVKTPFAPTQEGTRNIVAQVLSADCASDSADCVVSGDHPTPRRSSDPQPQPARAWRPRLSAAAGTLAGAVVSCLIIANVLVFVLTNGAAGVLARYANSRSGIVAGEYYRLVTAGFLHISVLHLLVNMVSLAIVGPQVEAHRGKTRFLGLQLLSALAASTCSVVLGASLSVGAQGAVLCVAGAVLSTTRPPSRGLPLVVGILAVKLAVAGTTPNVDVSSHFGGFIAGLVLGRVFAAAEPRLKPAAREIPAAAAIAVTQLAC